MTKINLLLISALLGQLFGVATYGIEPISILMATIASLTMIVVGIYSYMYMCTWIKIAITPIFISCLVYLPYSVIPLLNPIESVDYLCMLLESMGIIFIAVYFFINRRGSYAKRERKEAPDQKEANTPQEMRVLHLSKYRHQHRL